MSPPPFSWAVLFSGVAIAVAGGLVFSKLTRRWTTDRPRAVIDDWASARRFRCRRPPFAQVPAALSSLETLDPSADLTLTRGPVTLARVTTAGRLATRRSTWHLLIRTVGTASPPAGLRPAGAAPGASALDLFALVGFPAVLPPERFVAVATTAADARHVADGPARGLLPPDVGLLVHGPYLTLDFSSRPFDPTEFERMLTVADQIVAHVRAAVAAAA